MSEKLKRDNTQLTENIKHYDRALSEGRACIKEAYTLLMTGHLEKGARLLKKHLDDVGIRADV